MLINFKNGFFQICMRSPLSKGGWSHMQNSSNLRDHWDRSIWWNICATEHYLEVLTLKKHDKLKYEISLVGESGFVYIKNKIWIKGISPLTDRQTDLFAPLNLKIFTNIYIYKYILERKTDSMTNKNMHKWDFETYCIAFLILRLGWNLSRATFFKVTFTPIVYKYLNYFYL